MALLPITPNESSFGSRAPSANIHSSCMASFVESSLFPFYSESYGMSMSIHSLHAVQTRIPAPLTLFLPTELSCRQLISIHSYTHAVAMSHSLPLRTSTTPFSLVVLTPNPLQLFVFPAALCVPLPFKPSTHASTHTPCPSTQASVCDVLDLHCWLNFPLVLLFFTYSTL
jgi:hypothetical protein